MEIKHLKDDAANSQDLTENHGLSLGAPAQLRGFSIGTAVKTDADASAVSANIVMPGGTKRKSMLTANMEAARMKKKANNICQLQLPKDGTDHSEPCVIPSLPDGSIGVQTAGSGGAILSQKVQPVKVGNREPTCCVEACAYATH
eukprot:scaffold17647_cov47-Prasinocladus_malaysianus.AAC.1